MSAPRGRTGAALARGGRRVGFCAEANGRAAGRLRGVDSRTGFGRARAGRVRDGAALGAAGGDGGAVTGWSTVASADRDATGASAGGDSAGASAGRGATGVSTGREGAAGMLLGCVGRTSGCRAVPPAPSTSGGGGSGLGADQPTPAGTRTPANRTHKNSGETRPRLLRSRARRSNDGSPSCMGVPLPVAPTPASSNLVPQPPPVKCRKGAGGSTAGPLRLVSFRPAPPTSSRAACGACTGRDRACTACAARTSARTWAARTCSGRAS